jgi:hypothetical protein
MRPQKPFGGDLDINNPVADDWRAAIVGKRMADVEWQPLPALWPEPAVWTDVGELMLLVFTQAGVPTWEINRRAKTGSSQNDLIASGTADTFEAAKAAALFEARAQSSESSGIEDVTSPIGRPVTLSIADLQHFDA